MAGEVVPVVLPEHVLRMAMLASLRAARVLFGISVNRNSMLSKRMLVTLRTSTRHPMSCGFSGYAGLPLLIKVWELKVTLLMI